jgi:extracellular factor (EF) 3-hydroxypalmitic acid methyl ester biosynthesis protein
MGMKNVSNHSAIKAKENYLKLPGILNATNLLDQKNDKVLVKKLERFLKESQDFLCEMDSKLNSLPLEEKLIQRLHLMQEIKPVFFQLQLQILHKLNENYNSIEASTHEEFINEHRKLLQKYYLKSQFTERSVKKPLGYSGDFIQILQLLAPLENVSLPLFSQLMNDYILQIDPCNAHRNRIDYLYNILSLLIKEKGKLDRPFSFTSVGCGPAMEILRIAENIDCSNVHVTLIDMEPQALQFCKEKIEEVISKTGSKIKYTIKQVNVKNLLRLNQMLETQDFVYCAGLFDYLNDKFCNKIIRSLYENVNSDGLLLFTNVSKHNPDKYLMEVQGDWFVNERDDADIRSLCSSITDGLLKINYDETEVNLFAQIQKTSTKL